MRAVTLAFMVLCLQIGLLVVNATDLYDVGYEFENKWVEQINETARSNFTETPVQDTERSFISFGELWDGLNLFLTVLSFLVTGFSLFLLSMGVPAILAHLVAIPVVFIYIIAIVQIIRGFGFGGSK